MTFKRISQNRDQGKVFTDKELILKFLSKLNGKFNSFRQAVISIDSTMVNTKYEEMIQTLLTDTTIYETNQLNDNEEKGDVFSNKRKRKDKEIY